LPQTGHVFSAKRTRRIKLTAIAFTRSFLLAIGTIPSAT